MTDNGFSVWRHTRECYTPSDVHPKPPHCDGTREVIIERCIHTQNDRVECFPVKIGLVNIRVVDKFERYCVVCVTFLFDYIIYVYDYVLMYINVYISYRYLWITYCFTCVCKYISDVFTKQSKSVRRVFNNLNFLSF